MAGHGRVHPPRKHRGARSPVPQARLETVKEGFSRTAPATPVPPPSRPWREGGGTAGGSRRARARGTAPCAAVRGRARRTSPWPRTCGARAAGRGVRRERARRGRAGAVGDGSGDSQTRARPARRSGDARAWYAGRAAVRAAWAPSRGRAGPVRPRHGPAPRRRTRIRVRGPGADASRPGHGYAEGRSPHGLASALRRCGPSAARPARGARPGRPRRVRRSWPPRPGCRPSSPRPRTPARRPRRTPRGGSRWRRARRPRA